jgi:dTDP-4-amino-4,6-dideoxygalactose transaminase
VGRFEEEFAAFVGARHAVAVSNCTTALQLVLEAAGAGPGREVITVSHSYIATANAIVHTGAQPVFVDVDPATFNIIPEQVEAALTPRTVAVLCVHQIGMPCDLEALLRITRAHQIPLIEDAACAIGSEIHLEGTWQRIGRPHGDAACFSFHPRKLLTTGDGGMITTNRDDWNQWLRLGRQHAMGVSDTKRHAADRVTFEAYDFVGWNYRMTDIQAAVGRVQLRRMESMLQRRRELAALYSRLLAPAHPRIQIPREPDWARSNFQSYCVRLTPDVDQVQVMQTLLDAGIATRRGIMCAHREQAYSGQACPAPQWCTQRTTCSCPLGTCQRLPHSEQSQDHSIILPLYHTMTEDQVAHVCRELLQAVGT